MSDKDALRARFDVELAAAKRLYHAMAERDVYAAADPHVMFTVAALIVMAECHVSGCQVDAALRAVAARCRVLVVDDEHECPPPDQLDS